MEAKLAYGQNAALDLDIAEEKLVASYGSHAGEPLDDIVAAVAAAILDPLGYPPLTQAVVAGDRIAIPVDPAVPRSQLLVAGLIGPLCEAGIAPADITVLSTSAVEDKNDDLRNELPEAIAKHVHLVIHNPSEREELGFLATSSENQPIYLNRAIQDADVVFPIGCLRPRSSLGYHGIHTVLFPIFADAATIERYQKASNEDSDVARRRRAKESKEAAWLLGLHATIQVIPGGGNTILQILAGDPEKVAEEGLRRVEAVHQHEVHRQAQLAIVGIDGDSAHQTWENVARAVNAGLTAVVDGGIIVICSELKTLPTVDSALQQLAREEDVASASHTIRGQPSEDAVAAAQLLAAREQANLFLLSQLEEDTVSELGLAPVEEAGDIQRLCNRCESCILISSAQFADTLAVTAS
jgi:nickel-dependent lactate racemase